jgi:hypothetical protein
MSELLKRLVQLTRAHFSDLLAQYWPGRRPDAAWDEDFDTQADSEPNQSYTAPPFEGHTRNGLPYSAELAEAYRALDLPYGTPLGQVAKRWKEYLKKCHPDRYANNPEKLADATKLTQELTGAYEKLKTAWERHQA